MKACVTNSSVCCDNKSECTTVWKYTYFPHLMEWNSDYAQFTIYFPGLGVCVSDIINDPRSGGWKIASSNDFVEQCLVKVWKGQSYRSYCFDNNIDYQLSFGVDTRLDLK